MNNDATRQEMRSYVCGQWHVEYYFDPQDKRVVYPWAKGVMPYQRVGARKVINHHVRSPLLGMAGACMTCHGGSETDLRARVDTIQDRTQGLIERSSVALVDLLDAIATARANGASDADLREAIAYQRRAQWRIDRVYSG